MAATGSAGILPAFTGMPRSCRMSFKRKLERSQKVNGFLSDLRFAVKQLVAKPGFAAAVILTLALGIGANVAVFSVLNGYLLKPLPYPQGNKLVQVGADFKASGGGHFSMSVPLYELIRKDVTAFSSTAIYNFNRVSARIDGASTVVPGVVATGSLFKVLGVKPALGHTFSSVASKPGEGGVAVISYRLWRNRFGAKPDVIGQTMQLDGRPVRVIGVMPKDFMFPGRGIDIWTPLTISAKDRAAKSMFALSPMLIGRLKSGISMDELQTQLDAVRAHVGRVVSADTWHDVTNAGFYVHAKSWRQARLDGRTSTLLLLQGAVLLLLLMTCANVANLLLSRVLGRSHEISMRSALGASRAVLMRQLLTESLCFAVPGGLIGVALGWVGLHYYAAMAWGGVGGLFNKGLDWRVGLAALVLVCLTAVLVSLLPLRHLTKLDLQSQLQEGGHSAGGGRGVRRIRNALVTIELTLATLLLAGSGLLLHSFANLQMVNPGYRQNDVLIAGLLAPRDKRANNGALNGLYGGLLERVRAMPGVDAVGIARWAPMGGTSLNFTFRIRNNQRSAASAQPKALLNIVDGGYFRALDMPILRGRNFNAGDTPGSHPVTIISSTLEKRYFRRSNPLGRQIKFNKKWYTIVGVAQSVKPFDLATQARDTIYLNASQAPKPAMRFVVHTAIPPNQLAEPLRKTIAAVAPSIAIFGIETMHQRLARSLSGRDRAMTLLLAFGGIALALAIIGVYGVLSYAVGQRRNEFGIRLALGAMPSGIQRLVILDGLKLLVIGLVVGIVLAVVFGEILSSRLFDVAPYDPMTLVGTIVVLLIVTFLACYIPARRASKLNPSEVILDQ